jgi:hypothetical protein
VDLKNKGQSLPDAHPTNPLMTALRLSGTSLKYTQQFRNTARDELLATSLKYGSPSLYITSSPADHKHVLAFAMSNKTYDFDPDALPPVHFDTNLRNKLAAEHPVENSQFFHAIVTEILGTLFGFRRADKCGIFSPVQTYYGMVNPKTGESCTFICYYGSKTLLVPTPYTLGSRRTLGSLERLVGCNLQAAFAQQLQFLPFQFHESLRFCDMLVIVISIILNHNLPLNPMQHNKGGACSWRHEGRKDG